ncbi:MAG: alpha-galactosidase, partial [Firmicutes bacterium]|nr:alpha-galactosidase [Bacillota bacterium]
MGITFDEATQTFHLHSAGMSYFMQLHRGRHLLHRSFGPALRADHLSRPAIFVARSFAVFPDADDPGFSRDTVAQEYPVPGTSDFGASALDVTWADGSFALSLEYESHAIRAGKPELPGLPASYVESDAEAQTLEIALRDPVGQLRVILRYSVFAAFPVVARSVTVWNDSAVAVDLRKVLSASLALPDARYELLQLSGAWGRERHLQRTTLRVGTQTVESMRGASSHQQNPAIALARPETTEDAGEAIGLMLVYSGNFVAGAQVDQYGSTRVYAGIHPETFTWHLAAGARFDAPEALIAWSGEGLGGLSDTYHRLLRTRVARGSYRDKRRPVLVNNWEATYFRFNEDAIIDLAQAAASLGIELFVLDDGWFGHRNDDRSSLGDWTVDATKLPSGLPALGQRLQRAGMSFGLWFEPEMVSPDSDLYRAHPEWCLQINGRKSSLGRHQLILDLSRSDVRQYIVEALARILESAPICYVKWDMNRNMTEVGSMLLPPERQRETPHRYMLGLYEVWEHLIARFPDILFEACAGGGGRFDAGVLHYMPQVWTSDNTDAIARLSIQFGTSLFYPASAQAAHVSAAPNHQVGRVTPFATRARVAMMGMLGYELDLRALTSDERDGVAKQIALYGEIEDLVRTGRLYRLEHPDAGGRAAWMFVA